MFVFRIWSNFAAFRDPLTITQNLTLSIPPKTTIGGMLAAILGIDYNEYFSDDEYFDFGYSLVLLKPIIKKSFAQNYIADYTKLSAVKLDVMKKWNDSSFKLQKLEEEKLHILNKEQLSISEEKKLIRLEKQIEKARMNNQKRLADYSESINKKFVSPKPIFRELLIAPEYLIFIDNFKYENKIFNYLKKHYCEFSLYMGNSEFAANYEYIESRGILKKLDNLDSFTGFPKRIIFETGKKYTSIYAPTKTVGKREYRDYKNMVICDKGISLKEQVDGYVIKTDKGIFNCEFI